MSDGLAFAGLLIVLGLLIIVLVVFSKLSKPPSWYETDDELYELDPTTIRYRQEQVDREKRRQDRIPGMMP